MSNGACVHILSTTARHVSRVRKEAASLLRAGLAQRVALLAKWEPGLAAEEALASGVTVTRVKLASRFLPRQLPWQVFKEMEWRHRVVSQTRRLQPRILFCHSVMPLRTAVQAARMTGAALVYDAHELETETVHLKGAKKRVARYLEKRFIHQCGAVMCVSDSIADWYQSRYGLLRPAVVRNVPDVRLQTDFSGSTLLRETFRIPNQATVFIYQGGMAPGRRVEQILRVFATARPDRHLILMGFGPLEGLVREAAAKYPNIHFLSAVEPDEVLRHTASADVGFAAHLEPSCLNHRYALPNKFFEYLLAGLPVWVNDVHEEMARLVASRGFGWVTPYEDEAMTEWVNSLRPDEIEAKRKLASESRNYFSWAHEEQALLAMCRAALPA